MPGKQVVMKTEGEKFVDESADVLPGCNTRYGPSEDVVEHQGRDSDFRESATQRFLDDAVHAAADEHRAALDVHGAYGERKQHHADDEPRRRLAHRLLGDAT